MCVASELSVLVWTLLEPLGFSPTCERREELVEVEGGRGLRSTAKALCGLSLVGRSATTDQVEETVLGEWDQSQGSARRRRGGSKGVYTEGIQDHYCRLFRASTSLLGQRENTHQLIVMNHLNGCLHLSLSSSHHLMCGLVNDLPFHSLVQTVALQRRGLENLPFSVFEGG